MIPILTDNSLYSFRQLYNDFLTTSRLIDKKQSLGDRKNKSHTNRLLYITAKLWIVLASINKESHQKVILNKAILNVVKITLWIIKAFSIAAFMLSFYYHYYLYKEPKNLENSWEYFNVIISLDNVSNIDKKTKYLPLYGKYRYHILKMTKTSAYVSLDIYTILHKCMHEVISSTGEKLQSASGQKFCSLYMFPKVMENYGLKAAPDSYHSMVILSVSSFLWMAYTVLLREKLSLEIAISKARAFYVKMVILEKIMQAISTNAQRISSSDIALIAKIERDIAPLVDSHKDLERLLPQLEFTRLKEITKQYTPPRISRNLLDMIILLLFLLNIPGANTFQKTKTQLILLCICAWEIVKILLIFFLGFI